MGRVHLGGLAGRTARTARELPCVHAGDAPRVPPPARLPGEGEPEFVNDTTRRLDGLVEEARLEALRGDWEGALRLLDEAGAYGRPRAAGLGDQIRRLLGKTYMVDFGGLATDPRYTPELLPLLTAEHAAHSYRDDRTLSFHFRGAEADLMGPALTMLDGMRKGTYAYTASGAFGEAVERARELARWGDTDAAWRELTGALPSWEPLGPDHLAPVGWIADPLLGPLLTAERGASCCPRPGAARPVRHPGRRRRWTRPAWPGSPSRTRAAAARATGSSWSKGSSQRSCRRGSRTGAAPCSTTP